MQNYFKDIKFSLVILMVLIFSSYFSFLILKYPLIGIGVSQENGKWKINEIYANGWAADKSIHVREEVLLVNGMSPEKHSTVFWFNRIEMAESVTIGKKNGVEKTFNIIHGTIVKKNALDLVMPSFYLMFSLLIGLFFYQKNRKDKAIRLLMYFLFMVEVAYLSAFASARGDIAGRVINTAALPGTLVLFIHFIKSYYKKYDLNFISNRSLTILYIVYITALLLLNLNFLFPSLTTLLTGVKLSFFIFILGYFLYLLRSFYYRYKGTDGQPILKILFLTLFLSFSPFVLFYAVPTILIKKEILSAETTSWFLLFIPVMFIYMQISKKLFDIEFLLSRIRYFSILAIPLSAISVLFSLMFIQGESFFIGIVQFGFFFVLILVFLYIKENLDYKLKNHLFFKTRNFENSLYSFFQKAKRETKTTNFIGLLIKEINQVLSVDIVYYLKLIETNSTWFPEEKGNLEETIIREISRIPWNDRRAGSLIEISQGFCLILRDNPSRKEIIFFGFKKFKTNLNVQEKQWLETLSYFSSILLENFLLIEELVKKIASYKGEIFESSHSQPNWVTRLLFSLSEKERANLSIDLHDTVLQEQLRLLRDVEKLQNEMIEKGSLYEALLDIRERILDGIHLIRETCNELRPPFLNEMGITQSIQNLIEQTRLRSNFLIHSTFEYSIQNIGHDLELTIYRIVQELLNNAMKHSNASEVNISLKNHGNTLIFSYYDDGKGMEINQLNDSFKTMGITGIKERVRSSGGNIEFWSAPKEGLRVVVSFTVGGRIYDKSFNR